MYVSVREVARHLPTLCQCGNIGQSVQAEDAPFSNFAVLTRGLLELYKCFECATVITVEQIGLTPMGMLRIAISAQSFFRCHQQPQFSVVLQNHFVSNMHTRQAVLLTTVLLTR